jgi:hypothetical protein
MGKKRENDTYCLGLWRHDMPEQLLWYCRQPAERQKSPLILPTWTWASAMHGVRFMVMKKAKNGCGQIKFEESSQTLILKARRKKVNLIPHHTLSGEQRTALARLPTIADMLEHEILPNMTCGLVLDGVIAGKGVLDEDQFEDDSDIFALQLTVSTTKQKPRPYYHQWVLLLRKSNPSTEAYERIGAGVIQSENPALTELPPTRVCIR